jgi:hypothetical protein
LVLVVSTVVSISPSVTSTASTTKPGNPSIVTAVELAPPPEDSWTLLPWTAASLRGLQPIPAELTPAPNHAS